MSGVIERAKFWSDVWVHTVGAIVLPSRATLPPPPDRAFMDIMYGIRGHGELIDDLPVSRQAALRWVMRCDAIMAKL